MKLPYLTKKESGRILYPGLLIFFVLNFTAIQTVSAQDANGNGKIFGGLGYFSVGFTRIKPANLNSELQKAGFGAFPSGYITFGGGGHAIIGNFIIGGEGQSMSSGTKVSDNAGKPLESGLDAGYGFLNIGYVAVAKKSLLLYPMVGLGGGGMQLKQSDAAQAGNFNSILQDHRRSVVIDNGGFLLNFQLAADFVLNGNEKGRGGLLAGLHAGYIYAPVKWNWTWDGAGLAAGPDVNLDGLYIRFTLGAGGYSRAQNR